MAKAVKRRAPRAPRKPRRPRPIPVPATPVKRGRKKADTARSVKPGPEMNHLRQLVTFSKRSDRFAESRRWIGFWLASAKSVEEYRNRNASQPCQRYPETTPAGY